eukprot:TRINITY_DN76004_c0_g1_i1.p1 TRINITY_DN76004_c0_g1~~TRINITY_DN76004_c0_g1_i1.p1  ORF type:complete len:1072 (-),score=193.61 TRINITY_DN76004_c0_g1_i1:118-3333(-)
MRTSLLGPGACVKDGGLAQPTDPGMQLSLYFYQHHRLDASQLLVDGFRDGGLNVSPASSGQPACVGSVDKCVLVLDRRRDGSLEMFVERSKNKLRKAKDDATQAMVLALLVSDTCGRSGTHAADLVRKYRRLVEENCDCATGEVLLGNLIGDHHPNPGMQRSKQPPTGAALAPSRALLFKALADWLGVCECTLERRSTVDGVVGGGCKAGTPLAPSATSSGPPGPGAVPTWNIVQIGHIQCIVDLFFDPGALYQDHSAKANEYVRLLGEVEAAAAKGLTLKPPDPPSSRNDLSGVVPRPPWHAESGELVVRRCDRIGRGGFGEVFHGHWAGMRVAVKEIKDTTPTDLEVVDFTLEIALLSQLNHPNILRFWRGSIEIHASNRSLLMVTEYVKQGGLSRLLHGHGGPALPEPLTLPQALSFGLDIARGVQYLHGHRILHLDLKSPNVLCALPWTAKLCDFGLAKIRGEQTFVQSTLQGVSPVWAPPEMFDDRVGGLTEKADVYSFAVIFFELLTKKVPFQEVTQVQLPTLKISGHLPRFPASVPEDCVQLMRQCCSGRPGGRPPMSAVVARLREVAVERGIHLAEVKPPAAFLRSDGGHEQRTREAEEKAARRLVEVDAESSILRAEIGDLQRRIEKVRLRGAELAAEATALPVGGAGVGGEGRRVAEPASRERDGTDDSWCEAFVLEVAGCKFRCTLCSKLFRGPEFARRHIVAKHLSEARRLADDAYFDCDISNEDALPIHSSIPKASLGVPRQVPSTGGLGRFSQALQEAAEHGNTEQLKALLALRADPGQQDESGSCPVLLAAQGGHIEALEVLVRAVETPTAEVNKQNLVGRASGAGLTPLHAAAAGGHCRAITTLLECKAAVDVRCARGKSSLLHAGENGHINACALLISAKADALSECSLEGETLLHLVARCGNADSISTVIAWRGDLLAQDRDGWTALHEAAHWASVAVEALCQANASVNMRSSDGETPLHVAVEGYDQLSSCQTLIQWRADPSAVDVDGDGPLHVAARKGSCEVCRALVQGKADINSVDHAGRTSLDFARRDEVRSLLVAAGAVHGTADRREG